MNWRAAGCASAPSVGSGETAATAVAARKSRRSTSTSVRVSMRSVEKCNPGASGRVKLTARASRGGCRRPGRGKEIQRAVRIHGVAIERQPFFDDQSSHGHLPLILRASGGRECCGDVGHAIGVLERCSTPSTPSPDERDEPQHNGHAERTAHRTDPTPHLRREVRVAGHNLPASVAPYPYVSYGKVANGDGPAAQPGAPVEKTAADSHVRSDAT